MNNLASMSRRALLAAAAALSAAPNVTLSKAKRADSSSNRLWYRQPATEWEEALPVGNGRVGAMVFGRVAQERIQLNEDTLWSGGPYTPDNSEALNAMPVIRQLLQDGDYGRAVRVASEKVMAKPLSQMSYGCLGDIFLTFPEALRPVKYQRELDLENAITRTEFEGPDGVYIREVFASAADNVIVLHLHSPKGKLNFGLSYQGPGTVNYRSADDKGAATVLTAMGADDWLKVVPVDQDQGNVKRTSDGPDAFLVTGHNVAGPDVAAALTFAMRVKILGDGITKVTRDGVQVHNATRVTLIIAGATSYTNFADVTGDPVAKVRQQTNAAAKKSYESLKLDHINDYRALYAPVSLDLGHTAAAENPTDLRLANETADDPGLTALYFQYARYLMISSSRTGSQPSNLQGIWNAGTNAPWGSKFTININTEMNYWPADPAGLSACVDPLLKMTEELSVTGARTAKTMYGARGWVAHHNTDLWRATAPIDGPRWGLWPCGGAWLCNALWDHYEYSQDGTVLTRLYPLLTGASLFFLDTLVEDPKGRGLITSPSLSPENEHPFGAALAAGPAMDRQIIRDLFDNTLKAGAKFGFDQGLMEQISKARARIAPDKIDKAGLLQEWLEDWDVEAPEQNHRHVSHLYAVYPSGQINIRDTPDLLNAAKASLIRRGDFATGWGTAWRLCLWARMGEGDHAYKVLKSLTGPQRTYPNLFDAHPPFQIDGNFGGAAGIMEMLVQSWGGEIILLPALPSAWPSGQLKGLKTRGNISVEMSWRDGKISTLILRGKPGDTILLRRSGEVEQVTLDRDGIYRQQSY